MQMRGGNVYASSNRAMFRELQEVATGAAADFQYPLSPVATELSGFWQPWIESVALFFRNIERSGIPVSDCKVRR
jgi:hypothetical protein